MNYILLLTNGNKKYPKTTKLCNPGPNSSLAFSRINPPTSRLQKHAFFVQTHPSLEQILLYLYSPVCIILHSQEHSRTLTSDLRRCRITMMAWADV